MYDSMYEIRWYSQVLLNGTWGSDDCEWDWEETTKAFRKYEDAMRLFKKQTPTADTPIIRLYRKDYDHESQCWGDSELIKEIS